MGTARDVVARTGRRDLLRRTEARRGTVRVGGAGTVVLGSVGLGLDWRGSAGSDGTG